MKKDLHPKDYRLVVYKDSNSGDMWLTKSTAPAKENIKYTDGNEYPLVLVHVSSKSHPFFTGEEKVLDIEGRVDKFKKRQEAADKANKARAEKAASKAPSEKREKPAPQKI
ncbi:MAG: large subunit ribosomal protein [Patescibacteria group bacterium]|nr:large subunit ribosomal protein [Patescibacteria group bacterium]